jgi:hypothetical protein
MEKVYTFQNNIETTPSGHKKLIDFYNSLKDQPPTVVVLDLKEVNFIDANQCALLGAMVTKLTNENGHSFACYGDQIDGRFNILKRNGFIKTDSDLVKYNGSSVPLATFQTEDDVGFLNYISNELLGHDALRRHSLFRREAIDHFSELFANISTHARTSEEVFVCGQYYPNRRVLNFSIVDVGVGFLPPIQEHTNGIIQTAEQAIDWALMGNTTKKDAPGGLGIKSLYEYCGENRGSFNIISGDCFWGNNLGTLGNRKISPFCGTIIHLMFKC